MATIGDQQQAAKICAELICNQHYLHQGRETRYALSPTLGRELGVTEVVVQAGVGHINPSDLIGNLLHVCTEHNHILAEGFSVRWLDRQVIISRIAPESGPYYQLSSYLQTELEAIESSITSIKEPLERIDYRRVNIRACFATVAREVYSITQIPIESVQVGIVGSYNHSPLKGSDLDYVVVARDSASTSSAEQFVQVLEEIVAPTTLEISNIVRGNSGGKRVAVDLDSFKREGFSTFHGSFPIKPALYDCSAALESASGLIENLRKLVVVHLSSSGWTAMDGAHIERICNYQNHNSLNDYRLRSRLITKNIQIGLCVLGVAHAVDEPSGVNFDGLINHLVLGRQLSETNSIKLRSMLIFSQRTAEMLSTNSFTFNSEGSFLTPTLKKCIDDNYQESRSFLRNICEEAGVGPSQVKIQRIMLKLKNLYSYLNYKYFQGGRSIRAQVDH